jgi:feruloyl esterase
MAGSFTPPGSPANRQPLSVRAFCRVTAVATPTPDSHVGIEVWLPSAGEWNGKLLGVGNGGFSSSIAYPAMASALGRGYAVTATDTGHTGDDLSFGSGHPERIADWSYRAVHVMAETSKLIVRSALERFPSHNYFSGCSTGGQQALSEAQRYPLDFDGIVAGDPAWNRLNLIYAFLWSWMATHRDDGTPILASAKLPALADAAMQSCDAKDGLKDGLIGDPRDCRFDPAVLACKGAETDACLTPLQVEAAAKVYGGLKHPRTGAQIFPGWAVGSELGWRGYITEPKSPVRGELFSQWAFHDPSWERRTFDWDRDVDYINTQLPFVSALSTDLRAFRDRGGKLLMYTGLADPVVPPQDTIDYYEQVGHAMGGIPALQSFFRFFGAPGVGHCGGGVGPGNFDALATLEAWVEQGTAPASMLATQSSGGRMVRSRPLCPYPSTARYKGTGSIDEAASFACVAP